MVSVEEGKRLLKENLRDYVFEIEEVDIVNSLDRLLGENIYSNIDVPDFNRYCRWLCH